ncbi:MAG: hypothetical protein HC767_08620, partial [Akkermansiaceae bacterium]|nr:hypothetical protein [Akkermansiaceae bacterium]
MPEALAQRLEERTGLAYLEGYGLSETMATTHVNPTHRPKRQCAGIPYFDTDSRVIDPVTFAELGPKEVGESLPPKLPRTIPKTGDQLTDAEIEAAIRQRSLSGADFRHSETASKTAATTCSGGSASWTLTVLVGGEVVFTEQGVGGERGIIFDYDPETGIDSESISVTNTAPVANFF